MRYKNPFKNLKLDSYEREIYNAVESGKVKFKPISQQEKKRWQAIARATLEKKQNINIRLSQGDLHSLKVKAMQEGIPYQTLAASILHKYAA